MIWGGNIVPKTQRYRFGLKMGPSVNCWILLDNPISDLDYSDSVDSKNGLTCLD